MMTEKEAKKVKSTLMKEGRKKGLTKERLNAYVYGAMRNSGWKPKSERNSGGKGK